MSDLVRIYDSTGTTKISSLWVPANGLKAPGTKPAIFVDHGICGAWEFSDATDDTLVANMRLSDSMLRSIAPTLSIGWSSTSTSGNCYWQIEYLYNKAGQDTTAVADDTLLNAAAAASTAEGLVITNFTLGIPLDADICLHLRIKRRADLAADTINGDTVELHGLCFQYTESICTEVKPIEDIFYFLFRDWIKKHDIQRNDR